MIRNAGIEPTTIEYLKTPPSREELKDLIARMDIPVRALLRRKGMPYEPLSARLAWASEAVLDILPAPQTGAFRKEGGESVVDRDGRPMARPESPRS